GVAFALGLVAGGGELLVGLGLLAGELLEVALLVGELPVGLRFVVRQLVARLALLLVAGLAGGELLLLVLQVLGDLCEARLEIGDLPVAVLLGALEIVHLDPGVGELLVGVGDLSGQVLRAPFDAGQLLVLLLLLPLQLLFVGLLQALAHLGRRQIIDQLVPLGVPARRRGGFRRFRAFGRRRLLALGIRLVRRRFAGLVLRLVEGGQDRLGGHRGRYLNGRADVDRLAEVLDALSSILESGHLQHAVEEIGLRHQLVLAEAVVLREFQLLLELRLGLFQLAIVISGRRGLVSGLDLGQDRFLICGVNGGGAGAGSEQQRAPEKRDSSACGRSRHASSRRRPVTSRCLPIAVARRSETGSPKW